MLLLVFCLGSHCCGDVHSLSVSHVHSFLSGRSPWFKLCPAMEGFVRLFATKWSHCSCQSTNRTNKEEDAGSWLYPLPAPSTSLPHPKLPSPYPPKKNLKRWHCGPPLVFRWWPVRSFSCEWAERRWEGWTVTGTDISHPVCLDWLRTSLTMIDGGYSFIDPAASRKQEVYGGLDGRRSPILAVKSFGAVLEATSIFEGHDLFQTFPWPLLDRNSGGWWLIKKRWWLIAIWLNPW